MRSVTSIGQFVAKLTLVGLLAALCGCTDLPASGPWSADVRNQRSDTSLRYGLVQLTPETISILHQYEPRGLAQLGLYQLPGAFTDRRKPSQIRFGIGDVVSITIFEAAAGGLFIPSEAGVRPGNFVQIPNQGVDEKGDITVPYAGAVRAMGRTAAEIQNSIVNALRNRAIEPQVVVSLLTHNTSSISVRGEVNTPGRFAVSAAGEKILDEITRAGGPKGQGFDTWVMLERKGKRATIPFGALVYESQNNIYARPNDTIYVYREP